MLQKALAEKLMLIGIDGLDPRFTRHLVDMGKLPNIEKLIKRGSCRHDLAMVGAMPTVTPPMWTTLATGAYPGTHGITCFFRASEEDLDKIAYNFDSRLCKAEQLWNVFAEAGKKTLVWHWPGSSWPPSSDSPNLSVVDGTSPGSVAMSAGQIEAEFLLGANEAFATAEFAEKAAAAGVQPCVVTDMDVSQLEETKGVSMEQATSGEDMRVYVLDREDGQGGSPNQPLDLCRSYIRPAQGWANAPEGAKEFVILLGRGLINRPSLILQNEAGVYDRIAIYKNKKETEPIVVIKNGEFKREIIDEGIKNDQKYICNRNIKVLHIKEDGSELKMWISPAMNTQLDAVWHPKSLFKTVTENVGYPTPTSLLGRQDPMLITDCMLANWYATADWQAAAIEHLIKSEELDVVFSHYHAVDIEEHQFIKHLAERPFNRNPVSVAEKWMEDLYIQTDYYLGKFLHYLDEGWTVLIFSDHGQVAPAHDIPLLAYAGGVTLPLMEQMGFTKSYIDENGKRAIDWTQTKAVMQREGHVYLNLIGRSDHGIVDPKDQYEVEEEIMTKLYELKDPETGHRIVSVALRNRDAVLLGQGGPDAGDILVWHAEGYNFDHDDCLSTTYGESDTSVSPIFIAAGPGIKEGYRTDRIIRQIDFAATVAVLGGVRMPAQCEGAPVYQILTESY